MESREILERAHHAKRLLEDPTLQKAFAGVREALVIRAEMSALGDESTHHQLVLSLQLLKEIRRLLERWVTDGQVEAAKAER